MTQLKVCVCVRETHKIPFSYFFLIFLIHSVLFIVSFKRHSSCGHVDHVVSDTLSVISPL